MTAVKKDTDIYQMTW